MSTYYRTNNVFGTSANRILFLRDLDISAMVAEKPSSISLSAASTLQAQTTRPLFDSFVSLVAFIYHFIVGTFSVTKAMLLCVAIYIPIFTVFKHRYFCIEHRECMCE
jgi:hypothetical protein